MMNNGKIGELRDRCEGLAGSEVLIKWVAQAWLEKERVLTLKEFSLLLPDLKYSYQDDITLAESKRRQAEQMNCHSSQVEFSHLLSHLEAIKWWLCVLLGLIAEQSVSLTGDSFQSLANLKHSYRATVALSAAVATGAGLVATTSDARRWWVSKRALMVNKHQPLKLNWMTVDALSGAVGEVVALGLLYPLDTLKVRCQANGQGAGPALRELLAHGLHEKTIRQLYAGLGSAAACSALIGAAHLLVFYGAKRASNNSKEHNGASTPMVTSLAGLAASLAGSVLEVPIENWRVRAQAGALKRPILSDMLSALSHGGLGALYWSYGAFLLKSIPYDVAELFTFSQLSEWKARNIKNGTCWAHERASEVAFGAAAGVAAALASMPCDVIKTRMDLTGAGAGGPAAALRSFFITGRAIVAAGGGPQALFVGIVPKLLQTVPSAIVYWCVVEATRRSLEPLVDHSGCT